MSAQIEWKVLNPKAEYEQIRYLRAPRIAALDNKKIGLYWNGKPGGDILLNTLGELLRERFKNIELIPLNLWHPIGAENIPKVAEQCDAVIGAIGD